MSETLNKIMTGLSVQSLKDFIDSQQEPDAKKLRQLTNEIVLSKGKERETDDLLFDIYKEIFKCLPVTSKIELFFFVKYISILVLLDLRQPQSPIDLYRKLFYSIDDYLITDELVESIAQNMISVSKDYGDLTHLCTQCAHLGKDWDLLVMKMSWLTLVNLSGATERLSTRNISFSQLEELLTQFLAINSIRNLLLSVHLVSLLVYRLASRESGKRAQKYLDSIREWLSVQPLHLDSYSAEDDIIMPSSDVLPLRSFITTLLVNWPELNAEA